MFVWIPGQAAVLRLTMISNGTLCVCPKSQQRCAAVCSLAAFVGVYVCLRWSDRGREKGSMVSSENRLLCLIPSCPDLVPVCAVPLPGAHSPWHKGSARVGFVWEGVRLAAVLVARAFFRLFSHAAAKALRFKEPC